MSDISDADFLAGRDLAVRMLRALEMVTTETAALASQYRDVPEQNNVALVFLLEIVERPVLAEGFAAVITDGINGDRLGFSSVDDYGQLTVSEMRGPRHDRPLQTFLASVQREA